MAIGTLFIISKPKTWPMPYIALSKLKLSQTSVASRLASVAVVDLLYFNTWYTLYDI